VEAIYHSEKKESLFKLIGLEPETLENLIRVTGWGRPETQNALLKLIADSRVTCKNLNGGRYFMVKSN